MHVHVDGYRTDTPTTASSSITIQIHRGSSFVAARAYKSDSAAASTVTMMMMNEEEDDDDTTKV